MSDYTPTTEEVRADYCGTWAFRNSRAEFDRWFAGVQAEAWKEGYVAGFLQAIGGTAGPSLPGLSTKENER